MAEPKGTGAAADENQRKRRERSAEEIVSRYQARIVKAQKADKLARVKHPTPLTRSTVPISLVVDVPTGRGSGRTYPKGRTLIHRYLLEVPQEADQCGRTPGQVQG